MAALARHRCADCGSADALVLEFDHRTGKRTTISRLVRQGASRRRLETELALCDVVCANCHRRRTAAHGGWFRVTGEPGALWSTAQVRNQRYVLDLLRDLACIDCGERDPVVLEFDHREGKRGNVSTMTTWASLETLRREISKCDVRCANCHRRRT